jgi:hypothetical protein
VQGPEFDPQLGKKAKQKPTTTTNKKQTTEKPLYSVFGTQKILVFCLLFFI